MSTYSPEILWLYNRNGLLTRLYPLGGFGGSVLHDLTPGSNQQEPPSCTLLDEESALGELVSCASYSDALAGSQAGGSVSSQLTTNWPEQVAWLHLNIWLTRRYNPTIRPEGEEQKFWAKNSNDRSALLVTQRRGSLAFPQTECTHLPVVPAGQHKPEVLGFPGDTRSSLPQVWVCLLLWSGDPWMKVSAPSYPHIPRHTSEHAGGVVTTVSAPFWGWKPSSRESTATQKSHRAGFIRSPPPGCGEYSCLGAECTLLEGLCSVCLALTAQRLLLSITSLASSEVRFGQ